MNEKEFYNFIKECLNMGYKYPHYIKHDIDVDIKLGGRLEMPLETIKIVLDAYLQHRVNEISDDEIKKEVKYINSEMKKGGIESYKQSKTASLMFMTGAKWSKNKILKNEN